jgi:hypothetical protein
MRIVAADSGSATLNKRFEPEAIAALAAVLVDHPYNCASDVIAKSLLEEGSPKTSFVAELSICRELLKKKGADEVHLDVTLGGIPVNELTESKLRDTAASRWARENVQKVLPELRKISQDIKRIYGVEVLALGKESIPVRIAELTAGAFSVLYASEKAIGEHKKLLLGLPTGCNLKRYEGGVLLQSLLPNEHEVRGFADDPEEILSKVDVVEILNPKTRGFRTLEIAPR